MGLGEAPPVALQEGARWVPGEESAALAAQAHLLHAWFMGLMLRVSMATDAQRMGRWLFLLFRRQHERKFLPGLTKLGLAHLPHALACARYHVLSNGIGGVPVQYHEEGPRKAWVRFRAPRWMYEGAVACGLPPEVGHGFLRGWYAHNGVSLGNPRLGFVCVSEDLTGQWGLCGYFREYDHDLGEEDRLRFAPDEVPPPFDETLQPQPPREQWDEGRLQRAVRNYALEYVRNGLSSLVDVVGDQAAVQWACESARLVGFGLWRETAAMVGAKDGGCAQAADYLRRMLVPSEEQVRCVSSPDGSIALQVSGLRVARDLPAAERARLLQAWQQLWVGAVRAHEGWIDLETTVVPGESSALGWMLRPLRSLRSLATASSRRAL